MIEKNEIIEKIILSENRGDGLDIIDLGPVHNYERMKKEVEHISSSKPASFISTEDDYQKYIRDFDFDLKKYIEEKTKGKNTGWNQVVGAQRSYKLFRDNKGWTEDNRDYMKFYKEGGDWKFHYQKEYPIIGNFINTFPNLVRCWINGLMPGTRFKPHYEALTWKYMDMPVLLPRIHITFKSDPKSILHVNGKDYCLQEGRMYFINIGNYHFAHNNSNEQRYNLLIDCILGDKLLNLFQNGQYVEPVSFTKKINVPAEWNKTSSFEYKDRTADKIKIVNV